MIDLDLEMTVTVVSGLNIFCLSRLIFLVREGKGVTPATVLLFLSSCGCS